MVLPNLRVSSVMTTNVVMCKSPLPIITIWKLLLFGLFCILFCQMGSIKWLSVRAEDYLHTTVWYVFFTSIAAYGLFV